MFHISILGGLGALFMMAEPTKALPWRRSCDHRWPMRLGPTCSHRTQLRHSMPGLLKSGPFEQRTTQLCTMSILRIFCYYVEIR